MIVYIDSLNGITPDKLNGFFVGWPKKPDPETHLKILQSSAKVILAIDQETDKVVGFINAISDNIMSAYIPLLEVLPEYRSRGIGRQLTRRMLDAFKNLYMIDLTCDEDLQGFYVQLGMRRYTGMMIRNFDRQDAKQ